MTTADLSARGFTALPMLSKAYTYCQPCGAYRWFGWWLAPATGVRVATCDSCQDVPATEARYAELFPVLAAKDAAA